jgi:riboflavin kinase
MRVSSERLNTLIKISTLQKEDGVIHLTTSSLGKLLNCSQQTASRRIQELVNNNFITRELTKDGQEITLTPLALRTLRTTHQTLHKFFHPVKIEPITIHGRIIKGLGEGAYYMGLEEYWTPIERKLGFEPYPGTLNVRVNPEDVDFIHQLESFLPIVIKEFKKDTRSFGALTCYPAVIKKTKGALIFAERTSHEENIIEFIAPVHLRSRYKLKDRDLITITIQPVKEL